MNLCECGCGATTAVRRGIANRFLPGHNKKVSHHDAYQIEDRGYKTPCWVWQRSKQKKGYGIVGVAVNGKRYSLAHMYFYEKFKGKVPHGLTLDHLCKIKSCVNPDHLEPVSNAVNCRRGPRAKLTMDKAQRIRELVKEGRSASMIAPLFGVGKSTIHNIMCGLTWTDR